MNLNSGQLATFAKVAAEGSFSGAAVALNLTQPAVSNQMNQLAKSFGEPLFTRHRLGVNLTPAGLQLLPHAQTLLRALEGAGMVASELRSLDSGTVRIAASTTIASYLLPAALARYRRVHPNLSVRQFVGNTREVVARLEAGGVDLALVEGHVSVLPQNLERQVLRYDEIALITLPDHPLAGSPQCELEDLEGLEIVWREKGSGTRDVTERALAGVRRAGGFELVGSEAVKEAVAEGLGVAFLSRLAVDRDVRAGFLAATTVKTDGLTRPLTLLRPPVDLLSRASRALMSVLMEDPR